MKVVHGAKFSIYVYRDHPPPHCHVRFNDGSDISVDIPLMNPRYGASLTREVREAILENLDDICETWDTLNA